MSDARDAGKATDQSWFAVRCVFQTGADARATYEERITLWRAENFEAAIALAAARVAEATPVWLTMPPDGAGRRNIERPLTPAGHGVC